MSINSIVYGHIGTISGTNVVVGHDAAIPTGTNNVVLGNGAGASMDSNCSYNVIIGHGANASNASYSVAIGQGAIAKASKCAAIGKEVVNTVSNTCVIGNSSHPLFTESFGRGFIRYTQNGELNSGGYYSYGTISAAQLLDGFLFYKSDITGYLYLPKASEVVAAFADKEVNRMVVGYFGSWYTGSSGRYFDIINGEDDPLTYYGPSELSDGESGIYTISITNANVGSEAVTMGWYFN